MHSLSYSSWFVLHGSLFAVDCWLIYQLRLKLPLWNRGTTCSTGGTSKMHGTKMVPRWNQKTRRGFQSSGLFGSMEPQFVNLMLSTQGTNVTLFGRNATQISLPNQYFSNSDAVLISRLGSSVTVRLIRFETQSGLPIWPFFLPRLAFFTISVLTLN